MPTPEDAQKTKPLVKLCQGNNPQKNSFRGAAPGARLVGGTNLSNLAIFLCARMVTASSVRAVGVSVAAVCGMLLGFYVQDMLKQATLARVEARVAAALRDAPPGPLASGAQPPLAAAPAPAPAPRAPR